MKVFLFILTIAASAAAVVLTTPTPAKADVAVEIDFDYFHERLLPSGHWVEVEDYGMCWYPADIYDDWCPYEDGHWVYLDDYGWYWESDEDFAWACYHYGRWHRHHHHGWIWLPGYEWGPAWVSWRRGGGYCAWAPLPPRATFEVSFGVRIGGAWEHDIHHNDWICVSETNFLAGRVRDVRVRNNVTIINNTTIIGAVQVQNNVVVNKTIEVNQVERNTGRKVERRQVREARTLGDAKVRPEGGNEVKVFKPRVKQGSRVTRRDDNDERAREAKLKTVRERHEAERQEIAAGESDPKRRSEREQQIRTR